MPPRVSVITVVKNGERYLAEALRSILDQTLAPFEIVLVDGQSTDRTAAIARTFAGVRYLWQPDQGLAQARNLGLAAAQGELIAFLDHDDLWAPDKLRTQVGYLLDRPTLGYTTTLMQFARQAGEPLRGRLERRPTDQPRVGCTPSALLAWRALFEQIGRFDPAYAIGCDADWFSRARDHQIPTAVVPAVLLIKRLHQTNLSTAADVNRQELFSVIRGSLARRRGR